MSVFIRRFTQDPGLDVLLNIEAVDILDLTPPGAIIGVGSGTALLVGEFEDGPFNTTEEVSSATDLQQRYGGFGYTYGGIVGNNPSARSRQADGALDPEYWNGNASVQLQSKRFRRLLVTRVDTSVGAVEFTRLMSLSATQAGATDQTFNLEPLEYLVYGYGDHTGGSVLGGGQFLAGEAVLTSGVGVYPTLFVGGETLVLEIDTGTPLAIGQVTVTFQATDQTQAQVIARINAAVGYDIAVDVGGGVTTFTGRARGLSGMVNIVSASAAVLAAINIAVGITTGTGNVGNIDAVTLTEIDAVAGITGVIAFDRDSNGALRLHGVAGGAPLYAILLNAPVFGIGDNATGTGFNFGGTNALGPMSSEPDGFATLDVVGTYPTGFVGGETMTVGVDGEPDVTVTFQAADQTAAQVAARVNAAMGFEFMVDQGGFETFSGRVNGGQLRFLSQNPATPAPTAPLDVVLGGVPVLPFILTARPNPNESIPAGTQVVTTTPGVGPYVTMQTVAVRGTGTDPISGSLASGPYEARVRPGKDDGSDPGTGAFTITDVQPPISPSYFAVVNPAALVAALSESAIDAAYVAAINATNSVDTVASEATLMWSARQSNVVRNALRQVANEASANGSFGRIAAIRPPLGTTRAQALGSGQPGVNAYRDQRVVYTFPGVRVFVPGIAARGTAGGAGFAADGVVNVGSDGFLISVCSQLNPEDNPGQLTGYTIGALGLESGNPDVLNMGINDYIAFRAKGICAPRMESGTLIFQSGITSVNPTVFPSLRNIARRRMADYIQDSLAVRLKAFGKQLSTPSRRAAIVSEIRSFMNQLLSPGNVAAQRIDGFKVDPVSGNTPETLGLGIFRVILSARTLASLDSIVLQTTVGELVDVSEAA